MPSKKSNPRSTRNAVSTVLDREQLKISAARADLSKTRCNVVVVGVAHGPNGPKLLPAALPETTRLTVESSLSALGVSGSPDELVSLPPVESIPGELFVLIGVGHLPEAGPTRAEGLRRAAGSALRQLAGRERVALALPANTEEDFEAIAQGAALGAFTFSAYREATKDSVRPAVVEAIIPTKLPTRTVKPLIERALALGEAVNITRILVDLPPLDLYPETFADVARETTAKTPVTVTVTDDDELSERGFGGLTGVGQGSPRGPRLVKLDYKPSGAKTHLAFVGKGITFDSGGLSLKPTTSMVTMKLDMAGAAAVLGAVLAIARMGLKIHVTGWLCLAENLPSGDAQRPSDVISTYGGRTVEVTNTDAEGRLVLADGIVAAAEDGADMIVDIATLTGAQGTALGPRISGVMGTEPARDVVVAAATHAGEPFWPMPLPADLRSGLDSRVADIANSGPKLGGMLLAGLFLQEFVPHVNGHLLPWAHLDIAQPAFNEGGAWGYTPREGTGVGVRTLVAIAEQIADDGVPTGGGAQA